MKMAKKLLSMLLAVVMVLSLLPTVALATDLDASQDGTVYMSVSFNGVYKNDQTGKPMAYVPVSFAELATVDLDAYGLSDYLYDADGDGSYEITALHLVIYVQENLYGGSWSDVTFTGSPGSSYFAGGLFGQDENLNYYLNGAYPLEYESWGATSDHIVLQPGDFIDLAGYSCWGFFGDEAFGFQYFADENGEITHTYTAQAGAATNIQMIKGGASMSGDYSTAFVDVPDHTVYYGTTLYEEMGSVTTDANGCASVTFSEPGTYYLWANGSQGTEGMHDWCDSYFSTGEPCVVSAPAFAKVAVTENADQAAAGAVIEKIPAIGSVDLTKETAIAAARAAYDALSDTQKALVTNYTALTDAEAALQQLKDQAAADQAAADQAAANAVEEKIAAIGAVTVFSGKKVETARSAFDGLTDTQKALVENVNILTAAESALEEAYNQAAKADHKGIFDATGSYIAALGTPGVGSIGGEWMVIDLTRAGQPCPEGYYQNVVDFVKAEINDKEQLHRVKSTENSRVILALTAAGYDVTDVDGHNLLMGLTDMTYIPKQGINGPIWALIAFDSHGYEIPTNPNATEQATREKLIAYILEKQLADGGWDLANRAADPDMTGMAIQALAPYYKTNDAVKAAVDKALDCLSNKQMANGGFGSVDGVCTESCAQVVVALTALGIDPETDPRFVKNGVSVLDAMCLFAVDGGGFAHIPGDSINGMATEQGQYALAAYFRFKEGKTSLYDMTDVTIVTNEPEPPEEPEPTTPETPEEPEPTTPESQKDASNNTPQTGDNTPIAVFAILMAVSAACLAVLLLNKKKYTN